MAMSYVNLSSFYEVAKLYESVKPMRGRNVGKDVRPLADRKRDHERVKKISPNCYALMCGGYYDEVYGYYYHAKSGQPTLNECAKLAPIVWHRMPTGTTTVSIRNGIGHGTHTGHYSFLERFLPRGMMFHVHGGKQYVSVLGGKQYYLPKCMYVPRNVYDHAKQAGWLNRGSWMRASDDGSQLTFTFGDDNIWHLVGDECEVPLPPRVLVNKKLKAKYKQGIADYLAWISAMAPMLQTNDWQYRSKMRDQVREAQGHWGDIDPELMRKVVMDENHTLRLPMAVDFVSQYSTIRNVQSADDVKQVRAQFNRWINKTCGFTTTKER